MNILQLKNGQFKDFDCLKVAYEMKFGKGEVSSRIFSASVTAELFNHNSKAQREMMYKNGSNWSVIINKLI